jgi:hypothetical protein
LQHLTLRWVQGPTNIYTRESRAQSVLQHLEEEFRAELEEKQHIIAALNTKVGFRESRTQRELQHLEEEFGAEAGRGAAAHTNN